MEGISLNFEKRVGHYSVMKLSLYEVFVASEQNAEICAYPEYVDELGV
jgi:hypothetical protein